MLSTEIAACRSVSWCWAPGVCISRAPCLTLQSLVSPSSHSSLKLKTGRCAGTGGNLGAPGAKHKSRRQLNSVLQDAALIMDEFCRFMRFSSFHLTTWSRLCWVPPPLLFFHHLVSAFNLAFCSASQKTGGTVRAKRAKQLREEWGCQGVSVWDGCCAHS